MITLYQLPPAYGLPVSVSPFCTKLELYLRLTRREFKTETGDIRKSPNKKVPFVAGLEPDRLIADSGDIITTLEDRGPRLDEGLSDEARALGDELIALTEKDVYYAVLYSRFVDDEGWKKQKPTIKALVPWAVRPLVVPIIRKSQIKLCQKADFDGERGYQRAVPIVERIAEVLGDKPFLLDDMPRVADCSIWANLMHNAYASIPTPVRTAVRENDRLMAYVRRLAAGTELELPALP